MLADGFEDSVGADNVGLDEWPWVTEAVVIVGFGSKVDDDIGFADEFIHQLAVADIAGDEVNFLKHAREIVGVACVGEFVNNGYVVFGVVVEGVVYKVRPNKPCTTCNQHLSHAISIGVYKIGVYCINGR